MDLLIIGCIWLVLGIGLGIMASVAESDPVPIGIAILTGLGVLFITTGLKKHNNNNSEYPTAMDVYQGKTTLKIIYEDGIAVDSVVVFKTIKDK